MINQSDYPFVSIVFPNWNGCGDTLECLNSLRKLEYPKKRLEIIIIDNNSIDGSQQVIKKKISEMKGEGWFKLQLIENKKNLGPSIARNLGINSTCNKFEYIWMIDNDIVVDEKALIELIRVAENNEKVGILGSVNYYYNDPNKIWLGGGYIKWNTGRFFNIDDKIAILPKNMNVDFVSNSSLLIKNELIEKIGYFDPSFFCYSNDKDWCIRAKKSGYKICTVSPSLVWHKISSATNKITGFKIYFMIRNRILLFKKHVNNLKYLSFLAYLHLFFLPRFILYIIFRKEINKIKYVYRGWKDGIFQSEPSILE